MYRNHYIHQTPFPHNRDYSYDQLVDAAAFALRTIGKLSSAASENSDLKREIGDLTNTNRSLTATVRRQETEIADLKAQLTRRAPDLNAQLVRRDPTSVAIADLFDLVIFVPPAEQQHECAVCFEEVCNIRVRCTCDCVNRVCPACFIQSSQGCVICRAGPVNRE